MAMLVAKEKQPSGVWRLQIDPKNKRSSFVSPGQYVRIGSKSGNHVVFASINAVPGDVGDWVFYCKDKDDVLQGYDVGDEIVVGEAEGPGYPLDDALHNSKRLLFLAMGMGITSFYACFKLLEEYKSLDRATLFYGERDEGRLLYMGDIKKWRNQGLEGLITLSQEPIHGPNLESFSTGRIQDHLHRCKPVAKNLSVFACGSEEFERDIVLRLKSMGGSEGNMHFNHSASP